MGAFVRAQFPDPCKYCIEPLHTQWREEAGQGPVTKKKKSAEAPATNQNGAVEHQKTVPEAAGTDSKQTKNTKQQPWYCIQPAYRLVHTSEARRSGTTQCSPWRAHRAQSVQPDSHTRSQVSHRDWWKVWRTACSWVWQQQS